jgi:hypothetical protein
MYIYVCVCVCVCVCVYIHTYRPYTHTHTNTHTNTHTHARTHTHTHSLWTPRQSCGGGKQPSASRPTGTAAAASHRALCQRDLSVRCVCVFVCERARMRACVRALCVRRGLSVRRLKSPLNGCFTSKYARSLTFENVCIKKGVRGSKKNQTILTVSLVLGRV